MGELLYRIVERDRPASGVMLSAIVKYLNENDAGSGFYSLAESYGELAKGASKARRDAFWTAEVGRLFAANARRPR